MCDTPDSHPVRKPMNHTPPFHVNAADAWYFITICAAGYRPWSVTPVVGGDHRAPRSSPRTFDDIARIILDEARFFHQRGKWFVAIMTIMPDHLHFIVHGPPGGRPLPLVIGDFKRYLSQQFGVSFQRDFFDTRLRDDEHYAEKWRYIVRNPVTRGLVASPREWPHVIAFNRETGDELPHR